MIDNYETLAIIKKVNPGIYLDDKPITDIGNERYSIDVKPIPSVEDYFIVKYRPILPSVELEERKGDRDAVMAEEVPADEKHVA